jgi:hypothetical protein
MMSLRYLVGLHFLITTGIINAQTIGVSCPRFFSGDKSQRITCIESVLSQDKYHFTLASLPPSNGFAPGIVLEYRRHIVSPTASGHQAKKSLLDLSTTLAASTNSSWIIGGDLRWILPRGYSEPAAVKDQNPYIWLENHPETETLRASFAHRAVRTLYYFGEGSRSPDRQFVFAEDDTYGFLRFRHPVNKYLAFTAEAGGKAASLPASRDPSAVAAHFPIGSVPELATQPVLAKLEVGASSLFTSEIGGTFSGLPAQDDPHLQPEMPVVITNDSSFSWNQPVDGSPFTFQQFTFASNGELGLKFRSRNMFSAPKHAFVTKYVCQNNKQRQVCSLGQIDVHALLTISHTSGSNRLPFYLEPTLGGTDIDSRVTLRGSDNYRFRGRDAALLQFEYGFTVWDPFGAYVFYDSGKVAAAPSDLSPLDFRQDAGFGMSVRLRGHVVAQTYLAWGAGNTRWNYNFSKTF